MVFESEREKFEGFNTASGKYCCNSLKQNLLRLNQKVSIPQAVSTVATNSSYIVCSTYDVEKVSIPQAVSTVATRSIIPRFNDAYISSFNTASGKYCCNELMVSSYIIF